MLTPALAVIQCEGFVWVRRLGFCRGRRGEPAFGSSAPSPFIPSSVGRSRYFAVEPSLILPWLSGLGGVGRFFSTVECPFLLRARRGRGLACTIGARVAIQSVGTGLHRLVLMLLLAAGIVWPPWSGALRRGLFAIGIRFHFTPSLRT